MHGCKRKRGKENQNNFWREPAQRRGAVRQRRSAGPGRGKPAVASSAAALGLGAAALDPAEFKLLKGTCHARERSCGWVLVHLTTALLSQFAALGLHTFGLPSLRRLTII